MQAASFVRFAATILLILLLAACGQTPRKPAPVDTAGPAREQAARMLAAGDYLGAAQRYRELALQSRDPAQAASDWLVAAEAARSAEQWHLVREALQQLDSDSLRPEQSLQRRILEAESLLQENNPAAALAQLDTRLPERTQLLLQVRFHEARATAYRQLGNLLETARTLETVDALQSTFEDRVATQTELLRTLTLVNERALTELQPSPPGTTGGWMALALLVKQYGADPEALRGAFVDWRNRHPSHPALPDVLTSYQAYLRAQLQLASRIAVLLPQSGPFAPAAAAVRNGIVISLYRLSPDQRPEIRFYDSTDPAGIWPLYSLAVEEGAELVIGPLQKDALTQLLRAGDLPVPVLALNRVPLEAAPPSNLFMFSLAPEEDAHQAAERIWLDGLRQPIVLTPQGAWGDRVTDAFLQRWQSLGGEPTGVARYDASGHDHSEAIKALLQIDQSEERHREMQRWLGQTLEFEPRRRADVDAIFLAARPVQAQSLRPQLQFHRAANLPVYATSHAWSGQLNPSQLADLKGVMLADIPWILPGASIDDDRDSVAEALPNSASAYSRLYALGIDALRLAPHLKRLQSDPFEALDGSTGSLHMDDLNRVHRQLVWIQLDEPPKVLGFAPRLDLEPTLGVQPQAEDDLAAPSS